MAKKSTSTTIGKQPGSERGHKPRLRARKDDTGQIVTVAAAAASGVGLLGFVVLAGGVVLWRRFGYMQLPADDAVAMVPKSRLLATGADFLVVPFLLSALTVVGLVLAKAATDSWTTDKAKATASRPVFNSPSKRLALIAGLVVIAVGCLIATLALSAYEGHIGRFLLLLGLAFGIGLVISAAIWFDPPISVLAIVAFLSVGTFMIAFEYEKLTAGTLRVVPMAYSRHEAGHPMQIEPGYLITETSDRIVYATSPRAGNNGLNEFPRSQINDLEIGAPTLVSGAAAHAAAFAYQLCTTANSVAASTRGKVPLPCGADYLDRLAATAGISHPPRLVCNDAKASLSCAVSFAPSSAARGPVALVLGRAPQLATLVAGRLSRGVARLTLKRRLTPGIWNATTIYTGASGPARFISSVRVRN